MQGNRARGAAAHSPNRGLNAAVKPGGNCDLAKKPRESPTIHVIAGPNGAGKTTFAFRFLPGHAQCREFLNADLIAAGLSPFAPETQSLRAGQLLLERIRELAAERADFGFETPLSGRTYVNLLGHMRASGYRLALCFLWLPSTDAAVNRVAQRVQQGGRGIPPDVIRRRYLAGIRNFFNVYRPVADRSWMYDSSRWPPALIACGIKRRHDVAQKLLYWQIERRAENDHEEPEPEGTHKTD